MAADIEEILAHLPPEKKVDRTACEYIDREIRAGAELNGIQRETVLALVQACLQHDQFPGPPFESFCAYVYQEWGEEAKRSEEVKPRLAELVRKLKAVPGLAASVAQTAQQVAKEREARRARLAELMAAEAKSLLLREIGSSNNTAVKESSKALVARIRAARLGQGDNAAPNFELAALLADEAVEAYPNSPRVLFEAAGTHQLLAEKGTQFTRLTVTDRYLHMKQASTLYQQCLTCLATGAYANLKGEYDTWRKGLTELIAKIQKELETLQEKQEE
jgi:hypothetical protein